MRHAQGGHMNTADIPLLSTADLGRLIAQREVSPVEVTAACLGRIDDVDFKFNAYLTVCHAEALEAAREAEQAILRGEVSWASAWYPRGGEGPVLDQRHTLNGWFAYPGRLCPG